MKFPHLLESYNGQVAELTNLEIEFGTNELNMAWLRANAEQTLASYYLANDDPRYREHLWRSLAYRKRQWKEEGSIGAWDFVLHSCVALAIEDFDSQRELLGLQVSTDGYVPVTRDLYRLHKAILLEENFVPGKSKKTKGEEDWFRALNAIANGIEPEWSDFDSYWKKTRNRSHALTILQHRNLLKDGMLVFWNSRHL